MPSKRKGADLVLFSSQDPEPLVRWLIDTYGLQRILQSVAQYRPSGRATEVSIKRTYKKRASKKGGSQKGAKKAGKRGRPKGSKSDPGKGSRKSTSSSGTSGAGNS